MPRALPIASAPVLGGTLAFALLLASGCATGRPRAGGAEIERGMASWYGPGFHGRDTASGERYDMNAMTAAHRTLPFGSIVEVRNLSNGLTARVRINDRGPFAKNRIIDLSNAAARAIEMIGPGTAHVELRVVGTAPSTLAYLVQVGAFQERALAEGLLAALLADYPAMELRSDAVWHRVQISGFATRDEAEKVRRSLERAGYTALVIAAPER